MRSLRFHLLRILEWAAQRDEAWANARIRQVIAFRDRRAADAARHGAEADAICPPAEWDLRRWARGEDPRNDARERRP